MGAALPSLVVLVRHGATDWSMVGRHTGRTDVPLSELGVDQSRRVGPLVHALLETVPDDRPPLVFSSPLARALRTAELAFPDQAPTVVDALAELDYGRYEGLTSTEILALDPAWDLFTTGCPAGESPLQVVARCDSFVAKLERTAADRRVVAFTHGHLGRVLTVRLLGLPVHAAGALWNDTASVGVLNRHRGRYSLVGWNMVAGRLA
jgi:broad specificity phosphatase PhoE